MGIWRRHTLTAGAFDELVSERTARELGMLAPGLEAVRRTVSAREDISSAATSLLGEALGLAFDELNDKPEAAIDMTHALLGVLKKHAPRTFTDEDELKLRAERLLGIVQRPATVLSPPRGSLHASRLIVNAPGESLLDHLRSEFATADRVDLLCAFIKLSGFEKFRSELEAHCIARGRAFRLLTTTYMGASDAKAIERFAALDNAQVRVSFDESGTRLHAKAWIFHRNSGYSTAYIGSSNLSHAAQTDGLEWNVRITASDQPAVLAQMVETFEQYWADSNAFETFDPANLVFKRKLAAALSSRSDERDALLLEVEPKDYQKPVLAELEEARRLGRHKNLLVAATGTGKTIMAALDYRTLRARKHVDSLLFVAHRREILEQARRAFRAALQQPQFGELYFDGERPTVGRHVFASIDSLGPNSIVDLAAFDMVILDEAHHTAAVSWESLLKRVQPKELLGLTGTPERADGLDYDHHFPRPWVGNLRIWNAIPHALVPFRYYMLDVDGIDLSDVKWRAGRYASEELSSKLVSAADVFVMRAVKAVAQHIARPEDLRGIAFCASISHAEAVCERFVKMNYKARVLTGLTDSSVRRRAQDDLNSGQLQLLCVVDLYNEGVDIPNVNTVFFFRPTESSTVFLQQLGRGLRRAPTKSELVVFDLTGRQHLDFRFDQRLRALLGHTPMELRNFVEDNGNGRLPAGCHFHFDEIARTAVLDQLRRAIPTDRRGLMRLVREPALSQLTLADFLATTDVDIADIYAKDRCWTMLRRDAGLDRVDFAPDEQEALQQVHKLLHVGDALRLEQWARLLRLEAPHTERDRRLTRMLFNVIYGSDALVDDETPWRLWTSHPALRGELAALLPVLRLRNALLSDSDELDAEWPLVLHGRYLQKELQAAFDHRARTTGKFRTFKSGVEAVAHGRFDLLLVTLSKNDKTKEHLRYRDFPLHETRFHWQSTASTRQGDAQGRRHLFPKEENCTPLLFVREREDERRDITMAHCYLGAVEPDGVTGERPITIEWKLRHAMPQQLLELGRVAN
jgi:superfamily II DNA or RNA helicase/HKD family nuclease